MTKQQIVNIVENLVEEMRNSGYIPRDTGNMALHGLNITIYESYIVIYMNTNIAPYAIYTTQPWESSYWHGKKNPNEGWWERFTAEFLRRFLEKTNGTILEER